jgi:outer membrane protein assembly factor BamB
MRTTLIVLALALAALLTAPCADAQKRKSRRQLLRPASGYGIGHYPVLKWRTTLGMEGNATPAIADLDLDGAMDIVFPTVNGNQLCRLTDNGRVVWRVGLPELEEVPDVGVANSGVTLGDVNRDGTLDILLTAGKTLLCFAPDGKERWRRTFKEAILSQPTIADLDADGKPEILVGANDNRLHVLTSAGKDKWGFATKSWIVGGVATGDLDGDGQLETVFGSMDYKIYCLNSRGQKKWEFATEEWVQSSPVIADVERDGKPEVLCASDDGRLYCLSNLGTLKWQHEFSSEKTDMRTYLAVGDLDRDGAVETVLPLTDGNLIAVNAFGDRLWTAATEGVAGSPLIVDLNGDGWQEVLFATTDGTLKALDTWGQPRWTASLGQSVEMTPALADVDSDGQYEIYVANLMTESRESGFFSQFEMTSKGGVGQWTALKGDPYRTGAHVNAADFGRAQHRGGDYATDWEPFGVGARPKSRLQPPRQLRVTALPLDDAKGNRDGALDPGETAIFKVRVANVGRGPSYENLLTLDLGDSPLTLNRRSLYIGWIAPGAAKTATFRLSAPPLAQVLERMRQTAFRDVAATEDEPASPTRIQAARPLPRTAKKLRRLKFETIALRVYESGVLAALSAAKVFNVPPLPPELSIVQRQLIDNKSNLTLGNGNRRLDAGESAVLRLLLTNTNLTTAKRATVRLTSSNKDILVTTPLATLENIVPYGGRWVSFGLRVARQTKAPKVELQLTTQTFVEKLGPAPPRTQTLSFALGKAALDTAPPMITVTAPAARLASLRGAVVTIRGTIGDASGITAFSFNRQNVLTTLKKSGAGRWSFAFTRPLKIGENVFPLSATDGAGNSATTWVRIIRKP